MQTIIMTVGTSLRTNRDDNLPAGKAKRYWIGQKVDHDEKLIKDIPSALAWMSQDDMMEYISAETNTFLRLNPLPNDEVILLYSDTLSGLECAELLKIYLEQQIGQSSVKLEKLPGINYDLQESSSLQKMAELLKDLIQNARGNVTLAATGGFKAQSMIMALVGNAQGVPVCYVHEEYRGLIYLPYITLEGYPQETPIRKAELPESGRPRNEVMNIEYSRNHHRPRTWPKVEKMLQQIPWVDAVYYDQKAYNAPKNGTKGASRKTSDGRNILWVNLYESADTAMPVAVETTGYTSEHLEQAAAELRERLGRLI